MYIWPQAFASGKASAFAGRDGRILRAAANLGSVETVDARPARRGGYSEVAWQRSHDAAYVPQGLGWWWLWENGIMMGDNDGPIFGIMVGDTWSSVHIGIMMLANKEWMGDGDGRNSGSSEDNGGTWVPHFWGYIPWNLGLKNSRYLQFRILEFPLIMGDGYGFVSHDL